MSTVKAVNFQHPSSAAANLILAADGTVTGGLPAGGRNLLYNGAMQVAQRGTSTASITTGGYYTADRWIFGVSAMGTWTQTVENDAPTGSGLRKSLKVLCTTADAAPAAGDYVNIQQILEGQDLQRIAKGTASAQQLTLSFWVKSNVTGTYTSFLYDADNARMVGASYTISASATWERKTITFAADTTGVFDNDNATSLIVFWGLGAGTNRTSGSIQSSWTSYSAANEQPGQVNVAAATNNYWQITGVQLEVGPVASAFEFKPFGQELRECQRYYWRRTAAAGYETLSVGVSASSTKTYGAVPLPETMRVAPTAIDYSTIAIAVPQGTAYDATAVELNGQGAAGGIVVTVATGSGSAGTSNLIYAKTTTTSYIGFSAEL